MDRFTLTPSLGVTPSANIRINFISPETRMIVLVPDMTYNVFGGTLSLTQSTYRMLKAARCCLHSSGRL